MNNKMKFSIMQYAKDCNMPFCNNNNFILSNLWFL